MKKEDLLDYHYQILEKLGEGGMGAVYKAFDQELEKEVAIMQKSSDFPSMLESRFPF